MQPTAKLFTTGGSQAVRLPAEFRFEGTEVYIHRDARSGDVVLSESRGLSGSLERYPKARLRPKRIQH